MSADSDCLFCKIIARSIPSKILFESDEVLGIQDIHPQAPVHALFMPKRHYSGVQDVSADGGERDVMGRLVLAANHVARQAGLAETGYRLVINCKRDGGQTVDHLHLHLLGGRPMRWPPG